MPNIFDFLGRTAGGAVKGAGELGGGILGGIGEIGGGVLEHLGTGFKKVRESARAELAEPVLRNQLLQLEKHDNVVKRLIAMGDVQSARKYVADTYLPFLKASPEVIESARQLQRPIGADWLTTAGKLGKEMDALQDKYGEVLPEQKDVFDWLGKQRLAQYRTGGFGKLKHSPFEGMTTPEMMGQQMADLLLGPQVTKPETPAIEDWQFQRMVTPEMRAASPTDVFTLLGSFEKGKERQAAPQLTDVVTPETAPKIRDQVEAATPKQQVERMTAVKILQRYRKKNPTSRLVPASLRLYPKTRKLLAESEGNRQKQNDILKAMEQNVPDDLIAQAFIETTM